MFRCGLRYRFPSKCLYQPRWGHADSPLVQYQDKGIQVNFKGLSFEDRTNPIASITTFSAEDWK